MTETIQETIIDYGFRARMGYIITEKSVYYFHWKILKDIVEKQEVMIGKVVDVVNNQISFNIESSNREFLKQTLKQ